MRMDYTDQWKECPRPRKQKCEGVAVELSYQHWRNHRVSDGAEVKLDGWDDGRKLIVSFEFHIWE